MSRFTAAWLLVLMCGAACSIELDPTVPVPAAGGGASGNSDGGSAGGEDGGAGASVSPAFDCSELRVETDRFLICPAPASFADARRDCRERGGQLARLSSAAQNDALVAASAQLDTQTNLWLGGRRDDEHVWTWPDGEVFWTGRLDGSAPAGVYTNWQAGEPNNTSTVSEDAEECACLTLLDGTWKDRVCSLALSYFCQLPDSEP